MSGCLCDDNFRSLNPDCPHHGTVTPSREQVGRTLRVLEVVEWGTGHQCPVCGEGRPHDHDHCLVADLLGHAPDCELAASIADHRKALGL